ncbi:MAG: hypothetical protein GXP49_13200 [Deltaproteobacteria bacterium]|nr:hypothetical protein [Deltaproteobacteria bacterium]
MEINTFFPLAIVGWPREVYLPGPPTEPDVPKLKNLVLESRNPDGTGSLPVALRNMHSTNRMRTVAPGLEALQQILEVRLQVRCILRCRPAINSHRAVLPCAAIGLSKPLLVNMMS